MQTINRNIVPPTTLPSSLILPAVEVIKCSNNNKLYAITGAAEPIIQFNLVFKAGRFFEEKRVVSMVTAYMLNKGTTSKSAKEIVEEIDFLGATIKIQANMYSAQISVSCLKEKFSDVLLIVKELLDDPSFPKEELSTLIQRLKQKLKVNQEKNNFIASQAFNSAIYGIDSAFGYETTPSLLDEVSVQDVIQHKTKNYNADSLEFGIICGDVGAKEIDLCTTFIDQLSLLKQAAVIATNVLIKEPSRIDIEVPKSVQSSIRIGCQTIDFNHKDFNDLNTVNTILGGYFGSRLMHNIREDKGYTYGIYSFINPIMDSSYFCISTDVGIQYKEQTLEEISKEIKRLQEVPVSRDELETVQNYLIGQMMKSVDGPLKLGSTLRTLLLNGARETIINEEIKSILNIDAARIMEVAMKYLDYSKMHKVIA